RRQLAITLRAGHHATNLRLAGVRLDQEALQRLVGREDWAAAEALIGDEVVRRHTASGTPPQVRERLAAYRAAGLDEIVLGGLYTPEETRRTRDPRRGPRRLPGGVRGAVAAPGLHAPRRHLRRVADGAAPALHRAGGEVCRRPRRLREARVLSQAVAAAVADLRRRSQRGRGGPRGAARPGMAPGVAAVRGGEGPDRAAAAADGRGRPRSRQRGGR